MIDPDFFGCSGKLTFEETWILASATGSEPSGDFYASNRSEHVVTSIDRVHRCSKSWDSFARIALNHAFGDVMCANAVPFQVMLSFEFGIDTPPDERKACSAAFAAELARRDIELGKCHSSRSSGVTAVTIATMAHAPTDMGADPRRGRLYISRPLGAFKLHYLKEMGIEHSFPAASEMLEAASEAPNQYPSGTCVTDISGHGLLGAALLVAKLKRLDLSLEFNATHALAQEVLSLPVECLENSLDSYDLALGGVAREAQILLTLRETAGPYLLFIEDGETKLMGASAYGLPVGHYGPGTGRIEVSWTN